MIKTYRIKETVQALLWTGKNKEELEIFVGEENLEWTLSTIKPPIPEIIKRRCRFVHLVYFLPIGNFFPVC